MPKKFNPLVPPLDYYEAGVPGGADKQVQFNDAGAFGGNANFTFDKATGLIQVTNLINFNNTDYNTKIGYQAGKNIVAGATCNVFFGYQAGFSAAVGSTNAAKYNIAFGYQALYSNTTGSSNIAFNYCALRANTTGCGNIANGYVALCANTTGNDNVALGTNSLHDNTSGEENMAVGVYALYTNTTGYDNVAIGAYALRYNVSGYYNVGIGRDAGRYYSGGYPHYNRTSNTSVYIGNHTQALANGDINEVVIGSTAVGNGSNSVTIGNNSIVKTILKGNVGIGTITPNANAVLDLVSTTKAFMLPRMTAAQRDDVASPTAGMVIYNSTTNKLNFYNGTAWEQVTSAE